MTKSLSVLHSLLLISAILMFSSCSSKNSESPDRRGGSRGGRLTVKGVIVTSKPFENIINSSGTVLPSESVDLTAEASGRVESILFTEGAHVKKNDLLLKINDDDLQAQLKKNELQIQLATEAADRQRQLFKTNNTSKEQFDIAVNQLATLNADRENFFASIRRREIRAPFDGIIGLRYVSEGAYVTSASRIASIQNINPLKVDFSIPEKYAGKVRVNDPVSFNSDETNQRFSGRVFAIEPEIDLTTRTLQLRALCDNRSEKIYPGAYVHVELRLRQPGGALMIPTQAIVPVLRGQTVLLKKNGVVASVAVRTGVRTAGEVQITDGLAPGDTVLTTGILQLRPGMQVNVTIE